MDSIIQNIRRKHATGEVSDEELAAAELRVYGPLTGEDLEIWYYELHREVYGFKFRGSYDWLHEMGPVEVQVLLNRMQAELEADMRRELEEEAQEWAPARDDRNFVEWFADRAGLHEEGAWDHLED